MAAAPSFISLPRGRQDSSLRGWNWTPGTASWVEPTAHALLFLRSLPAEMLSSQAAKRRQLAERMLYDRMCPGGGWNSGNPLVYGVAGCTAHRPHRLGAAGAKRGYPERAEIQMSLDWLESAYAAIHGAASLALAHRCLAAYGRPVPPLAPALGELYSHNRFFENVLTTAVDHSRLERRREQWPPRPQERLQPMSFAQPSLMPSFTRPASRVAIVRCRALRPRPQRAALPSLARV